MKRIFTLLLCLCLLAGLAPLAPRAAATQLNSDQCPDLTVFLSDPERRGHVEMMVGWYLRHDRSVRSALEEGYSAVFFFEGCSDNMDDPELGDISYYRVSAVCLVLRLDEYGMPYLVYINEDCSTLPDRPLEYAPRKEELKGDVGPATVCDGTYEIYSVKHRGVYEALHVRSTYADATVPAVYMIGEGYMMGRATMINIHTRNVNHILENEMWSEGCILVGDGEFGQFTELMDSTYYSTHDYFVLDATVGTVTINRAFLKDQLLELYQSEKAVGKLLEASESISPAEFLSRCGTVAPIKGEEVYWTAKRTEVMSLPCSNDTDARSIQLGTLGAKEDVELLGAIRNPRGALWYIVEYDGQQAYIYSENIEQTTWYQRLLRNILG